jgi:hypothetical protein
MKRLLLILLISLMALGTCAYLVFYTSPKTEEGLNWLNLTYFLSSFWLGVAGFASFLLYFPQRLLDRKHPTGVFWRSLRRGALIASLLTSIAFLGAVKAGSLVNLILILVIGILLEVYFSSRKRR